MKDGDYWKTDTTFESVKEDSYEWWK
jgi:hypothetical protein